MRWLTRMLLAPGLVLATAVCPAPGEDSNTAPGEGLEADLAYIELTVAEQTLVEDRSSSHSSRWQALTHEGTMVRLAERTTQAFDDGRQMRSVETKRVDLRDLDPDSVKVKTLRGPQSESIVRVRTLGEREVVHQEVVVSAHIESMKDDRRSRMTAVFTAGRFADQETARKVAEMLERAIRMSQRP